VAGDITTEALGTCFEVKDGIEGVVVLVAEGHVRIRSARQGRFVEAFGGMEVRPDLSVKPLDPREISAAWSVALHYAGSQRKGREIAVPWSQAGGSAAHSFTTPLEGPPCLVAGQEAYFALPPEPVNAPRVGTAVSADSRVYVTVFERDGRCDTLLELNLENGGWRECLSVTGRSLSAPAITPKGLVTVADSNGTVRAYDPRSGSSAWIWDEGSTVHALCVTPSGLLLLTTPAGITAIDSKNGHLLWKSAILRRLHAPATVLASGMFCAVSEGGQIAVLNREGKIVSEQAWDRPVASLAVSDVRAGSGGDRLWLVSNDGWVGLVPVSSGVHIEKPYGKQLTCGPTGKGLLAVGSFAFTFDGKAALKKEDSEAVMAIVEDGKGQVFVALRHGLMRLERSPGLSSGLKELEFAAIPVGEILQNGLTIISGGLVVTTTTGIRLFK
jgi:hypothetical protein